MAQSSVGAWVPRNVPFGTLLGYPSHPATPQSKKPAIPEGITDFFMQGLADVFGTFDWPKLQAEMGTFPSIAVRYLAGTKY